VRPSRSPILAVAFALAACSPPPPAPVAAPPPPAAAPPPPTASASAAPAAEAPLKLTAGAAHACALFSGGRLFCWGDDEYGQLGAGAGPASPRAVAVKMPAEIVDVAAGDTFTCGLDRGGQIYCVGADEPAEGDDLTDAENQAQLAEACKRKHQHACKRLAFAKKMAETKPSPEEEKILARVEAKLFGPPRPPATAPLAGVQDAVKIAAGGHQVCALRRSGEVVCWALGPYSRAGELRERLWKPAPLPAITDATAVAAGKAGVCAVRKSGAVACFDEALKPAPLEARDVIEVAVGASHRCAIQRDGAVACAGDNDAGELGDDEAEEKATVRLPDVTAIAAGSSATCARQRTGAVQCWGALAARDPAHPKRPLGPTAVPGIDDAVQIAVGEAFACAASSAGAVRCWGSTSRGRLGHGSMSEAAAPVAVPGLDDAVDVATYPGRSCAARRSGAVVCWGLDSTDPAHGGAPVPVPGLDDATQVRVDLMQVCALRKGGSVVCRDKIHGTTAPVPGLPPARAIELFAAGVCALTARGEVLCADGSGAAVPLPGADGVVEIAANPGHKTCARKASGAVLCWDTPLMVTTAAEMAARRPEPIPGIADAIAIATSPHDACAVRKGGTLECFDVHKPIEPLPVPRVDDAAAISASDQARCVLHRSGEVSCAGFPNAAGELGDGTFTRRPVHSRRVVGLADAIRLSVSPYHACALRRGGQVVCWGDDTVGQVSATARAFEMTPVRVEGLPSLSALPPPAPARPASGSAP
jgi:alpha-tubulin suppressor-like RCC1 family protein